jgi:predicted  nucleic acid-binding Zn-ribbon protein
MGSVVHADVGALLGLQKEDAAVHELEVALAALGPKRVGLDKAKTQLAARLEAARAAVAAEEKKQRDLQERIRDHKAIHEKNVAQLDVVKRLREATAAMAQVDRARRVLADEEAELTALGRRLSEVRSTVQTLEQETVAQEADQVAPRAELETEAKRLGGELEVLRAQRDQAATHVPKALLLPYNRIKTKRPGRAVVPLVGPSCGACDTVVPLQRRSQMIATGKVEVCEACGVLMYAGEG